MAARVKEALGWALLAVVLYALLFADLTGNGTLWDALRGVALDAGAAPAPSGALVETRVVPARPQADALERAQDRMLMVPREPVQEFSVAVVARRQPAGVPGRIAAAEAECGASAKPCSAARTERRSPSR